MRDFINCFGPKRHWYDVITRSIYRRLQRFMRYSKRWTLSRRDCDPYNPTHWRVRRRPKVDPLLNYMFPIIRAVYPAMIAHDIVAVQPMTQVTGADVVNAGW